MYRGRWEKKDIFHENLSAEKSLLVRLVAIGNCMWTWNKKQQALQSWSEALYVFTVTRRRCLLLSGVSGPQDNIKHAQRTGSASPHTSFNFCHHTIIGWRTTHTHTHIQTHTHTFPLCLYLFLSLSGSPVYLLSDPLFLHSPFRLGLTLTVIIMWIGVSGSEGGRPDRQTSISCPHSSSSQWKRQMIFQSLSPGSTLTWLIPAAGLKRSRVPFSFFFYLQFGKNCINPRPFCK